MALCRKIGWTYDEYLDAPLWFVNELIKQLNDETKQIDKNLRNYKNG